MSAPGDPLSGRVLLVVEDEYLVVLELAEELERRGATMLGPVPDVRRALRLLEGTARLDGALLDIRLWDGLVYPVAEALRARAIPFVFVSGFEPEFIPERFRDVPLCTKPLDLDTVAAALFGASA
ncbi:hypothetical protein [Archangium primigenium]|uniref:hypothetical protein n=1 Tax=[Archangium] primigenium TaxID=2792470 RepID=UPI00195A7C9B|nr:hypothetical protein [Archangium primigenium]MBM7115100.1 response regulator [Archangium primigenium]